jgi:predicted DNA-binding transcriptional regulator AlpA
MKKKKDKRKRKHSRSDTDTALMRRIADALWAIEKHLRGRPRKEESERPKKEIITAAPEQSLWMDESEVLRHLPISRTTLQDWVTKGRFPKPTKIGERRIAWRRKEVENWPAEKLRKLRK